MYFCSNVFWNVTGLLEVTILHSEELTKCKSNLSWKQDQTGSQLDIRWVATIVPIINNETVTRREWFS